MGICRFTSISRCFLDPPFSWFDGSAQGKFCRSADILTVLSNANLSKFLKQWPSKVFKGKKMAGRMGGNNVTVQNLKVCMRQLFLVMAYILKHVNAFWYYRL